MRIPYVIVFVSDMSRSVAFYRDVVGLAVKFETPEWSEFDTEGTTFALHRSGEPPSVRSGGQPGICRPGFSVPDLDGFHRRMTAAEVPCTQPPREVFGSRIAQYRDPDGLEFGVSESKNA